VVSAPEFEGSLDLLLTLQEPPPLVSQLCKLILILLATDSLVDKLAIEVLARLVLTGLHPSNNIFISASVHLRFAILSQPILLHWIVLRHSLPSLSAFTPGFPLLAKKLPLVITVGFSNLLALLGAPVLEVDRLLVRIGVYGFSWFSINPKRHMGQSPDARMGSAQSSHKTAWRHGISITDTCFSKQITHLGPGSVRRLCGMRAINSLRRRILALFARSDGRASDRRRNAFLMALGDASCSTPNVL